MAAHQSAVLGRSVLDALSGAGPKLTVFMGHDTNVTALAAALRVDLTAPGYANDDVPPGGALLFERLRDARTGKRFVRLSYRTQSPRALRTLAGAVSTAVLKVPGCRRTLCPLDRFSRMLVSPIPLNPRSSIGIRSAPVIGATIPGVRPATPTVIVSFLQRKPANHSLDRRRPARYPEPTKDRT